MRPTVFAAAISFFLCGTPAFAQDSDGDGIGDGLDNCSDHVNEFQDDTDEDDCGNLCDADYDNSGVVGIPDLIEFGFAFGTFGNEEKCHVQPIPGCVVDLSGLTFLFSRAGTVPGPSGTTVGTTACPL
jgi:hypothetical protein